MADPIVTHLATGEPFAVFCGSCSSTAWRLASFGGGHGALDAALDAARYCCTPRACDDCGASRERHYICCRPCLDKRARVKIHEQFAKAEKVSLRDYKGAFLADDEDYYVHTSEAEDDDEHALVLDDGTRFLWGTTESRPKVDIERECESWLEEHHEDAMDHVDLKTLRKAEVLVNDALSAVVTYWADTKVAVLLASNATEVK